MQLRDKKRYLTHANTWVFPGGHKNKNESVKHAALREFQEETNYKCKSIKYLMSIDLTIFKERPTLIHYFISHFKPGQKIICNEGQKLKFISLKQMSKLKMPNYLYLLIRLLANIPKQKD